MVDLDALAAELRTVSHDVVIVHDKRRTNGADDDQSHVECRRFWVWSQGIVAPPLRIWPDDWPVIRIIDRHLTEAGR